MLVAVFQGPGQMEVIEVDTPDIAEDVKRADLPN